MTFGYRFLSALLAFGLAAALLLSASALTPDDYDSTRPDVLEADMLYAESAFMMDMDTGEILLSKNSRVRMYPASTTKMMTMILALESGISLDQIVTIPREADDVPEGSSVIGIKSKDQMTWRDLLCGLMLRSGNDASNAIAVLTAGSIDAFVQRMNLKAAELGCEGTHFVNAHGYHNEDHYTTAKDLARIALYGMKNETFRQIASIGKMEISVTRSGTTKTMEIENRNSLVVSDSNYYYRGANGIKTGHHNKSGRCVVASAERDGVNLLAVVMDCATEERQFADAKKLFDYGFTLYSDYSMYELLGTLQNEIATVTIENAAENDLYGGTMTLRYGEITGGEITRKIQRNSTVAMGMALDAIRQSLNVTWDREMKAPVTAGEVMGHIAFTAPDGSPVSADLIATRSIEAKPEPTPTPTPKPTPVPTAVSPVQGDTGNNGGANVPRSGNKTAIRVLTAFIALGLLAIVALLGYTSVRRKRRRRAMARRRARRRRAMAASCANRAGVHGRDGRTAPRTGRKPDRSGRKKA